MTTVVCWSARSMDTIYRMEPIRLPEESRTTRVMAITFSPVLSLPIHLPELFSLLGPRCNPAWTESGPAAKPVEVILYLAVLAESHNLYLVLIPEIFNVVPCDSGKFRGVVPAGTAGEHVQQLIHGLSAPVRYRYRRELCTIRDRVTMETVRMTKNDADGVDEPTAGNSFSDHGQASFLPDSASLHAAA